MGTISMKKTKTKSRNIGYLFKEGVRGIFLHGFMSFAAICVTVACLIIIGSFSSILYNLSLKVDELQKENEIVVLIDETLNDAEGKSIGTEINSRFENVDSVQYVSKEERFESFVAEQGDEEAFTGISPETFRDRLVVKLVDNSKMEETVAQIQEIEGVAKVNAHFEIANGFTVFEKVLNIASIAIIIVLLIVSLFIISNTIKLAMYDRRDEIAIMKMVGATDTFIRVPYLIEGFIIGFSSAVIAFFAQWGLYNLLHDLIGRIDAEGTIISIVPFEQLILPLAIIFGIAGLVVGIVGSLLSIRKFLDV